MEVFYSFIGFVHTTNFQEDIRENLLNRSFCPPILSNSIQFFNFLKAFPRILRVILHLVRVFPKILRVIP